MDPNETWRLLIAARLAGDPEAIWDYADALSQWLSRGGWRPWGCLESSLTLRDEADAAQRLIEETW